MDKKVNSISRQTKKKVKERPLFSLYIHQGHDSITLWIFVFMFLLRRVSEIYKHLSFFRFLDLILGRCISAEYELDEDEG